YQRSLSSGQLDLKFGAALASTSASVGPASVVVVGVAPERKLTVWPIWVMPCSWEKLSVCGVFRSPFRTRDGTEGVKRFGEDGQPETGSAGAARLVVTIATLRKSRALVASPCTISLGPEVVVRNLPSSEIERIAGRLPNPVSTSPRP